MPKPKIRNPKSQVRVNKVLHNASTSSVDLAPETNAAENPPSILTVSPSIFQDPVAGGSLIEAVAVWQPQPSVIPSDDLVTEEGDFDEAELADQAMYVAGRATIRLDPTDSRKKKKCSCFCCKRRRRGSKIKGDDARTISCGDIDVESVPSMDEIVVLPSEILPLEMVASLELTPEDVAKKPVKKRRTRVPEKPDKQMSLWGIIKSAVGKDLTRFPLPVNFSEPLSMLQRLAEDYEYSAILDKASLLTDPLEQLAYVAAFTISSYASCALRTAKPFNPLLGETFEFDRTDDMGWRCISEQVCHHPPVACLHCESAHGWVQWQQFTMSSKFRGNYLEIHPMGVAHLRFKKSDNHYTWRKATTIVRNLIVGRLYIEQEGEMEIFNHCTNDKCSLKYTCGSIFSRDRSVSGKIFNSSNVPKWEINGAWDTEVSVTRLDASGKPLAESELLWRKYPLPSDAEKYYGFTVYTSQLNEMEANIAPTDSRHRPDQRLMENGLWDEANLEKQRLEDKQREIRKQRAIEANASLSTGSRLTGKAGSGKLPAPPTTEPPESEGVEPFYTPCWFNRQRDPITGHLIHMYNGEYWNCKETQDWRRCPSLFDK